MAQISSGDEKLQNGNLHREFLWTNVTATNPGFGRCCLLEKLVPLGAHRVAFNWGLKKPTDEFETELELLVAVLLASCSEI